jgi:hypothetical protein
MGAKQIVTASENTIMLRKYITPKELYEYVVEWSIDTLKRRIKNDGFPAIEDGNSYLIPVDKMKIWFKQREIQNS